MATSGWLSAVKKSRPLLGVPQGVERNGLRLNVPGLGSRKATRSSLPDISLQVWHMRLTYRTKHVRQVKC